MTSRIWYLLELAHDGATADEASAYLFELGANGIQEDPLDTNRVTLRAYFDPDAIARSDLEQAVRENFSTHEARVTEVEWDLADEAWRQHFKPFEIVPHIIVSPTWEHYRPRQGQRLITMDPGMAFGTGLHPTTRMTARAIYDRCQHDPLPAAMLDVGCGSGLLCLVAPHLGVERLHAVEIDVDALEVARVNCALNDVPGVTFSEHLSAVREQFPLVVANILFNTLCELRDEILRVSAKGGFIALSGITDGQVDELVAAYDGQASLVKTYTEGEWKCVVMERA